MPMESNLDLEAALAELGELLDEGKIEPLRAAVANHRRIRSTMSRYSPRIWMFPFGSHPTRDQSIDVFRNGIIQFVGYDCRVVHIGKRVSIPVLVFADALAEDEVVQTIYDGSSGWTG